MKIKHHKQIVNILYNEWDLGKTASKAKGKTCAWVYWFEILNEVEEIITEKENDTVIGICGFAKKNSKKHIIRKKTYGLLKWLLIHSPMIKNKKAIYKYNADYDYIPKELENHFDGALTILIVAKQYRGRNLGKKLLYKIFESAKNNNMKNIQILCDESSNYHFYEALNCQKVYEKNIPNSEPDKHGNITNEKGFIYEKKL
ncbi:MAG: GNAT family N-acetyltransferase [Bacilli bacterium]|jgi:ribosomal protein S18 acetylase RimI-like enzyme|nr:GNAT family N-acetyltransferase [Bacilli bacterium]